MSYFEYLVAEKMKRTHGRLGLLFDTNQHHYYYDMGTGKVAQLDDIGYDFLVRFFSIDVSSEEFVDFCSHHMQEDTLKQFIQSLESEHLLQAYPVDKLTLLPPHRTLEEYINGNFGQLLLELTGKCNFRCKYCIYHNEYQHHRGFNDSDMSWDIAKKTIDFAIEHSGESVTISFYGGEPLIRYDLIKKCIEYSLDNCGKKEVEFAFTTNLSLMTKEMADFFGTVPNLDILVSIDGPEEIHDASRVYANNKPTFKDVMRGLELISNAFQDTKNTIGVSAVFTPPYSYATGNASGTTEHLWRRSRPVRSWWRLAGAACAKPARIRCRVSKSGCSSSNRWRPHSRIPPSTHHLRRRTFAASCRPPKTGTPRCHSSRVTHRKAAHTIPDDLCLWTDRDPIARVPPCRP